MEKIIKLLLVLTMMSTFVVTSNQAEINAIEEEVTTAETNEEGIVLEETITTDELLENEQDVEVIEEITPIGGGGTLPQSVTQARNFQYDRAWLNSQISAAAAGDTITLLGDVELDSLVTIRKSITIDGNGYGIYLAEGNTNRHFLVTSWNSNYTGGLRNVIFKNLSLYGHNTESSFSTIEEVEAAYSGAWIQGGGIHVNMTSSYAGTVTLDNVTAEGIFNKGNGGVILVGSDGNLGGSYGKVIIKNSEMKNNLAIQGGVVNSVYDTLTIINSTFTNNAARNLGGVIYLTQGNYENSLTIEESIFKDNIAVLGGVLYSTAYGDKTFIDISNSEFVGNRADLNLGISGAIYDWNGRGGALYIRNPIKTTIKDSKFNNNSANLKGGAIDWDQWGGFPVNMEGVEPQSLTIIGGEFTGNRVDLVSGEGDYWLILNVSAGQEGGAISLGANTKGKADYRYLFIDGTHFENNNVSHDSPAWDLSNPTGITGYDVWRRYVSSNGVESSKHFDQADHARYYATNIKNTTGISSANQEGREFTNLYNNHDIGFTNSIVVWYNYTADETLTKPNEKPVETVIYEHGDFAFRGIDESFTTVEGKEFVGWAVNPTGGLAYGWIPEDWDLSQPYIIEEGTELTGNLWVTPVYKDIEVYNTVTSSITAGGALSPVGITEVEPGEDIVFTITPDEGYKISQILVDGEEVDLTSYTALDQEMTYTLSDVRANHTFDVVLALKEYAVVIRTNSSGTINPTQPSQVARMFPSLRRFEELDHGDIAIDIDHTLLHGDTLEVEIAPDEGYRVMSVYVNEESAEDDLVGTLNDHSFYAIENIQRDLDVIVIFGKESENNTVYHTINFRDCSGKIVGQSWPEDGTSVTVTPNGYVYGLNELTNITFSKDVNPLNCASGFTIPNTGK